jgi:uncharacterized damage-inducible protein DinB
MPGEESTRRRNRRRLDDAREMSMDFCMGEFLNGVFNQDCIDFARAEKAAKDEAAAEAARLQAEAEAAAKAAEEAKAAAENAILDAWTEKIDTGLPTPEEEIAAIEK